MQPLSQNKHPLLQKLLLTFLVLLVLIASLLINPKKIRAKTLNFTCDNRFVTLVNPVRGRNLWVNQTLEPLTLQYNEISKRQYPATWLLTYDALIDQELKNEVGKFNSKQELGIFLEVPRNLANDAKVFQYLYARWSSPQVVFLSAYSQSERKKLINQLFITFKKSFGYYPRSVGAWWIDSYSLNYMKQKYNIQAALIVADQEITDDYGVWGQWWGVPYYPSKANILTPASTSKDKQDVVIIQWAQRDFVRAYGEGGQFSNYSLQANDYLRMGKDINFFEGLIGKYLDCKNTLGQVTVGLETGMESVEYFPEYKKQLEKLPSFEGLQFVTMNQFAEKYGEIYSENPELILIGSDDEWRLTKDFRENKKLNEYTKYSPNISFSDYFVADSSPFLDRRLKKESVQKETRFIYWYVFMVFGLGLYSYKKKILRVWASSLFFTLASFGLILRSKEQFGWRIFYGPQVPYLIFTQIFLVFISFVLIFRLNKMFKSSKNQNLFLSLLPLSYAFDEIVSLMRVSFLNGVYYFGIFVQDIKFLGLTFKKPLSVNLSSEVFPIYLAKSFIGFNFDRLWNSFWLSIILYPLIHVVLVVILLWIFSKTKKKVQFVFISVLLLFYMIWLVKIFSSDPYLVFPIV